VQGRGSIWTSISCFAQGNKNVGGNKESSKREGKVYAGTVCQLNQDPVVFRTPKHSQAVWLF
jgi:hypothetical protein